MSHILRFIREISVPAFLAFLGWIFSQSLAKQSTELQESLARQSTELQRATTQQSIGKDYVGIAVSILEKPKDEGYDALRDWAVDLLKGNSPLKFTEQQLDELKSGGLGLGQGTIDLLNHLSSLRQSLRALSSSPDGKRIAVIIARPYYKDYSLFGEVYDDRTGKMIFEFGPVDPAFAQPPTLVWSQDSSKLLVGSSHPEWGSAQMPSHGTLSAFDVAQGKSIGAHEGGGLQSFEFSEDGRRVIIKTTDGTTEVWQLP